MESKPENTDQILAAIDNLRVPDLDVEAGLAQLKKRQGDKKPVTRRLWIRASAAAVLLLLVASYFFLRPLTESMQTDIAQQVTLALPDGSTVKLNADSKVSFAKAGFLKERIVALEGEAFFDVARGDRFVVKTSAGDVEVLGTSFNVYARLDRFEVACATGRVQVGNTILSAGQKYLSVTGATPKTGTIAPREIGVWKEGESRFYDVPLSVVIEELERQYDVQVETRGARIDELFTGGFTHANLEQAAQSVFPAMELEYAIINNNRILLK